MFNYTGCTQAVNNYLQTDMPFGPVVPDVDLAPAMAPSDHERA
jgi:hypothetical protein